MVAVAASDARMIGESTMKRAPARIGPGALGAGGGSWGPIRVIEQAESRNEAAATSGTAIRVTWAPSREIVCPAQKTRNAPGSVSRRGIKRLLAGGALREAAPRAVVLPALLVPPAEERPVELDLSGPRLVGSLGSKGDRVGHAARTPARRSQRVAADRLAEQLTRMLEAIDHQRRPAPVLEGGADDQEDRESSQDGHDPAPQPGDGGRSRDFFSSHDQRARHPIAKSLMVPGEEDQGAAQKISERQGIDRADQVAQQDPAERRRLAL